MADKTLKARIKLLYKTQQEWQQNLDYEPLAGEACIVYVPAGNATEPAVLAKIGDGSTKFKDLPWIQAVASDVHDWAKKSDLEWNDLSDDFKSKLAGYVGAGNQYRINKNNEVYTLQSREYDASTETWGEWTDVADSSIDVSNKVDHVLNGPNGKALIFNESDGGGAKFEHNDGTWSFAGVNDGGKDGIAGQIYAVNKDTKIGTRINITANGIYYTNGKANATYESTDEIATQGDIANAINNLGSALLYIGKVEAAAGETVNHALERAVTEYTSTHLGYTLKSGAVAIVDTVEFIYNGSEWQQFGNEGLYETRADATAAHNELKALIEAEEATRIAEDAKKTDRELTGTNGKALIFNEDDGGGAKFENNDGTWSYVGVNDGGSNGITGQIYSVDHSNGNLGTRINMTNDGFYYFKGKTGAMQYTAQDEIATKGDVESALDDIIVIDGNA